MQITSFKVEGIIENFAEELRRWHLYRLLSHYKKIYALYGHLENIEKHMGKKSPMVPTRNSHYKHFSIFSSRLLFWV